VGAAVPAPRRRLLPLVRVSCCAPGNPNASPPPCRRRQRAAQLRGWISW
jgi:hypothetical protein